jgi:hypothetical protein
VDGPDEFLEEADEQGSSEEADQHTSSMESAGESTTPGSASWGRSAYIMTFIAGVAALFAVIAVIYVITHSTRPSPRRGNDTRVAELRKAGLDEAIGTRDLISALHCAIGYYDKRGEYPPNRGNAPGNEVCQGFYFQRENSPEGWAIAYEPIPNSAGHVTRFRLRSGPDSQLGFDGPWLETDEQGLVMKRDHPGEPARAVSPMIGTAVSIVGCIDKNRAAFASKGDSAATFNRDSAATLEDMILRSKVECTGTTALHHDDTDPNADPNPNEMLYLLDARSTKGIKTVAVYTLTYVPRGARLEDGYDLYLVPYKGESGIRSYLRAADGTVHVTTKTRRATSRDPVALPCEVDASEICAR